MSNRWLYTVITLCGLNAAAVAQAPPVPTTVPTRVPTREERIREHSERVDRLIKANEERKRQQQGTAGTPAPGASPAPGAAPGQPGATAPGVPGQPPAQASQPGAALPVGPVQPAQPGMAPPIQKAAAPPSAAPQGARSESRTILMFQPLDSVVDVGETFQTKILADTKEGTVDEFSVLVKYPSRTLNPLAIDHRSIDPYIKGQLEYGFDAENGSIYISGKLEKPMRMTGIPIGAVVWEALEPTDSAQIAFAFGDDHSSRLMLRGSNVLGTIPGANDGVIQSNVKVRSARANKPLVKEVGERGLIITSKELEPPVDADVSVQLETPKRLIRAGEEFDAWLNLRNPDAITFDRLRAYVQFDPAVLEVIDTDASNRIRTGINMDDGFASDVFTFDYHRSNSANNEQGIIIYDQANPNAPLDVSGRFAKIRFRAKVETEGSEVVLVANAEGLSPTTDVSYFHQSLMQRKDSGSHALDGARIAVRGVLPDSLIADRPAQTGYQDRIGTTIQYD